jgi:8-oxo-dGTP diphosphatase
LPGGHIEPGELQVEAIRREIEEETALEFEPRFFGAYDELIPEHNIHHLLQVYEGPAAGEPQICPEVSEVRWFPLDEARYLALAFRHNEVLDAYAQSKLPPERKENLLAEYEVLRAEVLKRIELRYQTMYLTIVATGIFVGALAGGFVPPITLLLYPPLALCITIIWVQSDVRIAQIAEYIMQNVEQCLSGMNWEHWLRQLYAEVPQPIFRHFTEVSAIGVFMGTQALTVLVALFATLVGVAAPLPLPGWVVFTAYAVLLIVDIASLCTTFWFIRLRRKG